MTTIGLAGAGRIGAGLIRLLHTSPAARSLRLKTVLVRDRAKPRPELPADTPLTACPADLTDDPQIDVVVELLGGVAEPFGIVSQALSQGKAVVTANKNLLAERGPEIFALAAERRLPVGFEASVCAGMPIIRTLQEALRVDRITALEGIVNGTSNYLLTRMSEERASYAQCLADAQRLGFAEPDPGYDVSGQDAACKMGILATLAFGACVDFRRLPTSGIDGLALEDVRQAEAMGYRIKLVAAVRRPTGGRVDGEVAAVLLPLHHPLASIRMECNAVRIESEGLGETLLAGRGAGPAPTAVTLLADLLDIAEGRARIPTAGHPFLAEVAGFADQQAAASRYYLRLAVADRPGTLAQVAGCFASQGISIASLLQPEVPDLAGGSLVPLILTTHTTDRGRLDLVLAALAAAGCGRNVVLRIREH
ncbi:MAG: homoserine dehydrogenase [Candidatus Accumulibacter sp.]|uniref:homoserine dehydrogenase n=1 Tax=Accumulibacter sp. TaxID=2053492 RepID=UPI001A5F9FA3|nr:homoserine dehydrogenase [Accumulibacter sp.]MBL8391802.1 homoserine dehydrogenase [Accumulibacter sp.]HRD89582.1 homoserine dehydrogenase [Accumulibacter sp.]